MPQHKCPNQCSNQCINAPIQMPQSMPQSMPRSISIKSALDAAAKALNGGADMELGDQVWSPVATSGLGLLKEALQNHTVTENRVDQSVRRVLNLRMITGQFDALDYQPYTKTSAEMVNSTFSQALNLDSALQSFVLLKNNNNVLPMQRGKKTVLVGPHGM